MMEELDLIKEQLARLPTRRDQNGEAVRIEGRLGSRRDGEQQALLTRSDNVLEYSLP